MKTISGILQVQVSVRIDAIMAVKISMLFFCCDAVWICRQIRSEKHVLSSTLKMETLRFSETFST